MSFATQNQRSFNRFELKYAIETDHLEGLARDLMQRLTPDPYGDNDGHYEVWSRYYDTEDLRFYWEKIDGIKFRRKLRLRTYGDPAALTMDTPIFAEIKQRINRVTQKRRARLTLRDALAMCDQRLLPPESDPIDAAVIEEMLAMVTELGLQPTSIVGYHRRAFIGDDRDAGLRVTFDTSIRGRDVDLALESGSEGLSIVSPNVAVVEVKVNERAPYWLTEMIGRHNMSLVRVSKYCQSIERFGRAPRTSLPFDTGAPETDTGAPHPPAASPPLSAT